MNQRARDDVSSNFLIATVLKTSNSILFFDVDRGLIRVNYLLLYLTEVEPSALLPGTHNGLSYQPWMIDGNVYGTINGINE
jgi:hypothetical protein